MKSIRVFLTLTVIFALFGEIFVLLGGNLRHLGTILLFAAAASLVTMLFSTIFYLIRKK